jgi:hypothetical protein
MAARRRRDNIVFIALAALAVIGGLRAIFGVLFDSPPAGPSDATTVALLGHAQLAGSFAEDFVQTYLGATSNQQDTVGKYVSAANMNLPTVGQQVAEPAVAFIRRTDVESGVEIWTVTVSVRTQQAGTAASGTSAAAATSASAARRFYRVAVSVTDGHVRALSLPAMVPPPGQGLDLSLSYTASCSPDTPLFTVASGFLGAFLTGSGDVTRYTTVDANISALTPAPYSSVDTIAVSSDDSSCGASASTAHVLASINPKTATGVAGTLAYPMTMVRKGGQWQVRELDPVPALANPLAVVNSDSGGAGSTATSSTTPTSATTAVSIPPATHN